MRQLTLKTDGDSEALTWATTMTDPVEELDKIHCESKNPNKGHLIDLPLVKVGNQIDMLIGFDNYDLIRIRQNRDGDDLELETSLTKLSWFVRGLTGETDGSDVVTTMFVHSQMKLEVMFR